MQQLPSLKQIARALSGEVAGDHVRAHGPGHSRSDRSLSVKIDPCAPDGFVVHGFSPRDDPIACKDYVRQKVGLTEFKPNGRGNGRHRASAADITAMLMAATTAAENEPPAKAHIAARYPYTDADGNLLYEVVRLEPKSFRQRRPDGKNGWVWSVKDCKRVVYRLADLLQYPDASVFVCEGEKDADRVAALGHCATTVACGDWTEDCMKALANRDALILEDNDDAGRKKSYQAAQALHGVAKTVRIVRLPGLPDKGDVSDWLDADTGNAGKLADVCFDAPLWIPTMASPPTAPDKPAAPVAPLPPLHWIDMSNWDNEPIPEREWAILNRVPLKNISIDTLSRAFAGSEIDRVQVYAFAMHMQALAMVAGGSVTVLSHPSLQGIASGSGISGSTAWHGAFRFRQYLKGIKPEDGEQPDNDLRELQFKKNQYGPTGETVVVRYEGGLFVPVNGMTTLERAAQDQEDDNLFLNMLDQFEQQGRHVTDKVNPNNYGPAMFSKANGLAKARFAAAMDRLFAANKIHVGTYGRPSRQCYKITPGGRQ